MKFSILSALLALSATAVSAADAEFSGTIYAYVNSIPHPKTTFLKKGSLNGSGGEYLVTAGAACNGATTLPGKGHKGVLSGDFILMNNTWDFNGQHDNEISLGYIKLSNCKNCLSLTEGNALIAAPCPSFTKEIKKGNKFAWFHDKRSSAIWAYGGDTTADESNGLNFDATHLQTTGKKLTGIPMHSDSLNNVFLGLGHVNLGNTGKTPTGCQ